MNRVLDSLRDDIVILGSHKLSAGPISFVSIDLL
jgi:hypothetical protein